MPSGRRDVVHHAGQNRFALRRAPGRRWRPPPRRSRRRARGWSSPEADGAGPGAIAVERIGSVGDRRRWCPAAPRCPATRPAGRAAAGRRLERHPPVLADVDLGPGVGVVAPHPVEVGSLGSWMPGREADRHPRRQAHGAGEGGERGGELLAVAPAGLEQEGDQRLGAVPGPDLFVVGEQVAAQVVLQGQRLVVGRGRLARDLVRQLLDRCPGSCRAGRCSARRSRRGPRSTPCAARRPSSRPAPR